MKFTKWFDIVIIAAIIAVALIYWVVYIMMFAEKPAKAEIYYYSELVETIDLNKGTDMTFSIPQEPEVIFHLYKDGQIRFEESDCPDKVCINTGKISMIGQYAACLPNGVILKIVPSGERNDEDADVIVGN